MHGKYIFYIPTAFLQYMSVTGEQRNIKGMYIVVNTIIGVWTEFAWLKCVESAGPKPDQLRSYTGNAINHKIPFLYLHSFPIESE